MKRSFWTKGLLYKEWRQQRTAILVILLLVFFQPIIGSITGEIVTLLNQLGAVAGQISPTNNLGYWSRAVLIFQGSNQLSLFPVGGALLWGAYMMEIERRGHNIEALLAGPVQRRAVISTKWGLGIVTIILLNLPGAIVLLCESLGTPDSPVISLLGSAARWYFVQTGLECLTFSVGLIVAIGVGSYILAVAYAIAVIWLPYLAVSAIATTVQMGQNEQAYTSRQGAHMILYHAWPEWMQQAQTILSPYTYTGGTAYYSYYDLPQQISMSPASVVLGARNQVGMPPLSFSLLFPVCLLLAILLLWAGCKLFDQLSVEAWRQTFTLRGFALALLLFVWLSLAWLAGEIAGEIALGLQQDAQMATLNADHLLHSTSLPVATAWSAFIFWFAFAVGLVVQWLVWHGIRYLMRRRARLPVAA